MNDNAMKWRVFVQFGIRDYVPHGWYPTAEKALSICQVASTQVQYSEGTSQVRKTSIQCTKCSTMYDIQDGKSPASVVQSVLGQEECLVCAIEQQHLINKVNAVFNV